MPKPATKLYDAIEHYLKMNEADAVAGQLSRGRVVVKRSALQRLKQFLPDLPLDQIGFDEIRGLVRHFASRPVSPATGRKYAPQTAIDTIFIARQFFAYLADSGHWRAPAAIEKLFAFARGKLFTAAEIDKKGQVKTFTMEELTVIWRAGLTPREKLLFLLGLNCGFTQGDVATLRRSECHLDLPKPYIARRRPKTGVPARWRLWPETAELLRKLMAAPGEHDLALLTTSGQPLVVIDQWFLKSDAVRHEWSRVLLKADLRCYPQYRYLPPRKRQGYEPYQEVRRLSYKHLRKTGANMIRRLAGKDCAETYLAHADAAVERAYTAPDFKRLTAHTERWAVLQLTPNKNDGSGVRSTPG